MTRNGSTLSANVTGPAAQRSKQTNANATAQAKANAKVVAKSLADDPTAVTVGKGFFLPDTSGNFFSMLVYMFFSTRIQVYNH